MQYRILPATGQSLSVLGFGAMGFAGWFGAIDDNDAIRSLHTALDLGINVVDTARAYGRSEQVVGAALRTWSGQRPFVATKIQPRGPQHQFGAPAPVEEAFPKGWVTERCETSLRELGLDSVDLMQLHLYWPTWGHAGYWMGELQALKQAGKTRSIGISIPDHRQRQREGDPVFGKRMSPVATLVERSTRFVTSWRCPMPQSQNLVADALAGKITTTLPAAYDQNPDLGPGQGHPGPLAHLTRTPRSSVRVRATRPLTVNRMQERRGAARRPWPFMRGALHPRRGRTHRDSHRGRKVRARRLPPRLLRLDRSTGTARSTASADGWEMLRLPGRSPRASAVGFPPGVGSPGRCASTMANSNGNGTETDEWHETRPGRPAETDTCDGRHLRPFVPQPWVAATSCAGSTSRAR